MSSWQQHARRRRAAAECAAAAARRRARPEVVWGDTVQNTTRCWEGAHSASSGGGRRQGMHGVV